MLINNHCLPAPAYNFNVKFYILNEILHSEWLRERTEHLDIFLLFHPPLNGVLFPLFCLLVEGECQILLF